MAFGGVWWSGRFRLVLFGQVEFWVANGTNGRQQCPLKSAVSIAVEKQTPNLLYTRKISTKITKGK